jgi:U11/U12 small nuclear ribonucleoprotein SNRNP35
MAQEDWTPLAKKYCPLMTGSIDRTDTEPHDHGIIRALSSSYRPNKDVAGDPNCTVFVSHLNPKTDEETLESEFSYFGGISKIRLVRDIVTGHSRCYAFVEFNEERSAIRAERDGHLMEIDGREILVDFELERTLPGWVPRRLGGGFGGKKESGQLRFGCKDRPWRKPISMQRRNLTDFDDDDERVHNDQKLKRSRDRDRSPDRFQSRGRARDQSRDRHRKRNRSVDRSKRKRSRSKH